jgi:hypothetical protein
MPLDRHSWETRNFGRFRARVKVRDGYIVWAQLQKWGITRYVCFGRGGHERGWLPTGDVWQSQTNVRENLVRAAS